MRGILIIGGVVVSAALVAVLIVLLRVQLPPNSNQQQVHSPRPASEAGQLVLYCGRSKKLVDPLIAQFTQQTGIKVRVRYAGTAALAVQLKVEATRSPADVFWAQDAGALGAMVSDNLFALLNQTLLDRVGPAYRNPQGLWVATSGRARVLAYSTINVKEAELPASVFDLTDERYRDRVGWAPANASFQAFVTAMRKQHGDDKARQWLIDMKANGARTYPKNTAILQGIAAGEVDFGLPNHYYLLRIKKADANFPVAQTWFAAGDIGNLVNVAGVGILTTCRNPDAAAHFIAYLLSPSAQQFFVSKNFEYPVIDNISPDPRLPTIEQLQQRAPRVDLDSLEDIKGTQAMLRKVGLQ